MKEVIGTEEDDLIEIKQIMETVDKDGDGQISYIEFVGMMMSLYSS